MGVNSTWLRVTAAVTDVVILGEALALIVGIGLLSRGQNPWLAWRNVLLLGLDVVAGAVLMWAVFRSGGDAQQVGLYGAIAILLLSHGYREWEYLVGVPNRVCFNLPLFAVNNAKLVGLLAVLMMDVLGRR